MAGVSKLVATLTVALAVAPLTDGAVRAEVDRLVTALAAARHLPFQGSLPARIVTREAAERELAIGVGVSNANNDAGGEILKRLGLNSAGADTGALVAKLPAPGERPGATYDLATGRLLVPDFVPLDDQRPSLEHEIAHAIADQHFGLKSFLKMAPDGGRRIDGDAQRARLAIVEGDATLSVLELVDPHEAFLGAQARTTLAGRLRAAITTPGAARWAGELQSFTHVDGFLLAARARARGPWSAVDRLWADPPVSTEQVLHPEKYDACEMPVIVDEAALPELPGFGRPAASDVLGELATRAWLASVLPPEIAARAAAGWGGDRAGIYTKPRVSPDGGTARERPLVWLTVWDDSGEADDFARAATQVIATQAIGKTTDAGGPGGNVTAPLGNRVAFASPAGVYALDRQGESVALLLAAPETSLHALDQMLDGWRRRQTASRKSATRPRHAAPPGCPRRDRAGVRG